VEWCPCKARAPELAPEAPKMCWAGGNGNVPPSKSCIHTALVTQYGIVVACMTSYVGMGRVGHGGPAQGTCNPTAVGAHVT
jgi:hypothetical protein